MLLLGVRRMPDVVQEVHIAWGELLRRKEDGELASVLRPVIDHMHDDVPKGPCPWASLGPCVSDVSFDLALGPT